MSELLSRLRDGPCLLLDGGLGSELIARGLPPGAPPDLWTLERPEEVRAVHCGYVEAGSEAIHANTFGSNQVRLGRFRLEKRLREINRTAVELARSAGARFVLGDVGPTGEYLPPVGQGDPRHWRDSFTEQAAVLKEAGVDALHIETMTDLREALIALQASREAAPDLPILASLTFDRKKRGIFTVMGDPLVPSLTRLAAEGAAVVGANCSITSKEMSELAGLALESVPRPLVFQPNAGQPEATAAGFRYVQDPEEFAADMAGILAPLRSTGPGAETAGSLPAGRIAALGGCCGTDARFIAALRRRIQGG